MPDVWTPIKSLHGAYEMSDTGVLRNSRTKRILKGTLVGDNLRYSIRLDGKTTSRSHDRLFAEVFNLPYVEIHHAVGVTLQKDDEIFHFSSKTAAAEFLAERVYYSIGYIIQDFLNKYKSECFGWKVHYNKGGKPLD